MQLEFHYSCEDVKFIACDLSAENGLMEVIFDNSSLYKQTKFVKASNLAFSKSLY